jgi:hypothetical protein
MLSGFLAAGVLSGALARRHKRVGVTLAFAGFVALLFRSHFLDGASSGYLSAGFGWIAGWWLILNWRVSSPLLSSKARVVSFLLTPAWLYATLEWQGSPQVRAFLDTGFLHSNEILSNVALALGLTLVLAGFGCMQGLFSGADDRFFLSFGIVTAFFGLVFCLDAGVMIDFSIRHGDSMTWTVPLADHLSSWIYSCSVLLFSAYVLKSFSYRGFSSPE